MIAIWKASLLELRKTRSLTTISLLVALGVVLGFFTIIPNEFLKFGFSYIVSGLLGYLFGPVGGMLGCVAIDIIRFIVRPTGEYFIGFTLNCAITGLFYGFILYQKPLTLKRLAIAKLCETIVSNIILNTVWLTFLYGNSMAALLPVRTAKNLIAYPIETAILYFTLLTLVRVYLKTVKKA